MDIKKLAKVLGGWFEEDPFIMQIFDSVASAYGCLPSDLFGLSWEELLFNVQCVKMKSERFGEMLRQQNRKKSMIVPNISIKDLVDLI